jgi:membrane protein DedA with SNARE-associated domain
VAGIHDVGAVMYLVTNALSAVLWAVGIGLAAYFLGPTVIDFVADLGLALGSALGLLIAALVAIEEVRVRRRRARRDQGR